MKKRKIVQRPRQKPTVPVQRSVEHVRVRVKRDGSEEIRVFGPGPEGPDQQDQQGETRDQQTYAQRKAAVYDEQSKTLSKPDQGGGG
jgi:hypothetical protein